MWGWLASLACADKVHHVADVVNVAIGVNLLLPVASSFLKCFLDGLDIEPEKIVEKHLDNQSVTSDGLEEIAVAAQAVEAERSKGSPLAWWWWVADVVAACVGIWLLLSGLVDRVGLWCLLLFLPSLLAIGLAVLKYLSLRRKFFSIIGKVKSQAAARKKCESAYVKDYVKKCKAAINRNGNGRKKATSKSQAATSP